MAGFWDMAEGDGLPALSGGRGKYVRFSEALGAAPLATLNVLVTAVLVVVA